MINAPFLIGWWYKNKNNRQHFTGENQWIDCNTHPRWANYFSWSIIYALANYQCQAAKANAENERREKKNYVATHHQWPLFFLLRGFSSHFRPFRWCVKLWNNLWHLSRFLHPWLIFQFLYERREYSLQTHIEIIHHFGGIFGKMG